MVPPNPSALPPPEPHSRSSTTSSLRIAGSNTPSSQPTDWHDRERDYRLTISLLRQQLEDALRNGSSPVSLKTGQALAETANGQYDADEEASESESDGGDEDADLNHYAADGTDGDDADSDPPAKPSGWFSLWPSSTTSPTTTTTTTMSSNPPYTTLLSHLRRSRRECALLASRLVSLEKNQMDLEKTAEEARRSVQAYRDHAEEVHRDLEESNMRAAEAQRVADEALEEVREMARRCEEMEATVRKAEQKAQEAERERDQEIKRRGEAENVAREMESRLRDAEDLARGVVRGTAAHYHGTTSVIANGSTITITTTPPTSSVPPSPPLDMTPSTSFPALPPPTASAVMSALAALSTVATIVPPPLPVPADTDVQAQVSLLTQTVTSLRTELDQLRRRTRGAGDLGVFEREEFKNRERALRGELERAHKRCADAEREKEIARKESWEHARRAEMLLRAAVGEVVDGQGDGDGVGSAPDVLSRTTSETHLPASNTTSPASTAPHPDTAAATSTDPWATVAILARRASLATRTAVSVTDAQHARIEKLLAEVESRTVSRAGSVGASPVKLGGERENGRPPFYGSLDTSMASVANESWYTPARGSWSSTGTGTGNGFGGGEGGGGTPTSPFPSIHHPPSSPTPTELVLDPPAAAARLRDLAARHAALERRVRAAEGRASAAARQNKELKRLIVESAVGGAVVPPGSKAGGGGGGGITMAERMAEYVGELERTRVELEEARARVRELEWAVGEVSEGGSREVLGVVMDGNGATGSDADLERKLVVPSRTF